MKDNRESKGNLILASELVSNKFIELIYRRERKL